MRVLLLLSVVYLINTEYWPHVASEISSQDVHWSRSDNIDFKSFIAGMISNNTAGQSAANSSHTDGGGHVGDDVTRSSANQHHRVFHCRPLVNSSSQHNFTVQLVNATTLTSLLLPPSSQFHHQGSVSKPSPSPSSSPSSSSPPSSSSSSSSSVCHLVMFFSEQCQFSAQAAPAFNALARYFPDVRMLALDVVTYNSLNSRYGIVSVPMFVLFYNGRPAAAFNESHPSLPALATFLQRHTNLTVLVAPSSGENGNDWPAVAEQDRRGPVPTRHVPRRDWCLLVAWLVTLAGAVYWLGRSALWRQMWQCAAIWWREAQLHQHED